MKKLKANIKETLELVGLFILAGVLTLCVGHYYNKAMNGLENDIKEPIATSTTNNSVSIVSLTKESE